MQVVWRDKVVALDCFHESAGEPYAAPSEKQTRKDFEDGKAAALPGQIFRQIHHFKICC